MKEANDAAPAAAEPCVGGVATVAAGTTGALICLTAAAAAVTAGAMATASAAQAALTAATTPAAALALAACTAADCKPAASAVPPGGGCDTGWGATAVTGRNEAADALLACAVEDAVACACCESLGAETDSLACANGG